MIEITCPNCAFVIPLSREEKELIDTHLRIPPNTPLGADGTEAEQTQTPASGAPVDFVNSYVCGSGPSSALISKQGSGKTAALATSKKKGATLVKAASSGWRADFDRFWSAYPKKTGKHYAKQCWERLRPSIDRCLATLAWQVKSDQWLRGYVPHPSTWINQGRWDDEPDELPLLSRKGADHMRVLSNVMLNVKDKL